jgi:DNA-binding NarL/FixJ family response regulator
VPRTALVVDDQAFMRVLLRQLMEDCGFVVIGEAGDAAGALAAAAELGPDVVLLDVQLPDGTGLEVSRAISQWPKRPTIVLISTLDYSAFTGSCGADAFIAKDELSRESVMSAVGR